MYSRSRRSSRDASRPGMPEFLDETFKESHCRQVFVRLKDFPENIRTLVRSSLMASASDSVGNALRQMAKLRSITKVLSRISSSEIVNDYRARLLRLVRQIKPQSSNKLNCPRVLPYNALSLPLLWLDNCSGAGRQALARNLLSDGRFTGHKA